MSFYDDLGQQLRQAERLLAAEEAQVQAPSAAKPRRSRRRRPVLLGSLAAALALVVFVAVSTNTRTPLAQAGLAILDTNAVAAEEAPLSAEQRQLANASTAHPFDTPNGTGYAFLSRRGDREDQVCVFVPSEAPGDSGAFACKPRAEAEARGVHVALVPEEPKRALDVVVLPIDVATATYTPQDGGTPVTVPSVNGVAAFQPPANGKLSWESDRGRETVEVTRAFPATKLKFLCRDGTVVYTDETGIARRREVCAAHGGLRQLLGVPTDVPETDTEPENRSRFVDRATGRAPTPAPSTP